jgi:hypothetical protein
MAMTGARIDRNVFKCATVHDGLTNYYWEFNNQRNGMLSCTSGDVMVGLYVGGNCADFLCFERNNQRIYCAQPLDGLAFEYVDSGTQDSYPMHVCREDVTNPYQYAMAGINVGANLFECDR